MKDVTKMIQMLYKNIAPIKMSNADMNDFHTTTICHICMENINNKNEKVRDHCHLSGVTVELHTKNVILSTSYLILPRFSYIISVVMIVI